ncbi:MAG TPA: arginine deiminase family protein [Thermoanaerobaculaceae bacterium]|nr:arginine deiminase family protein [Thermoanaerobaculaceae bacterium]HRS15100.1 arginine deiminase family protein [Thermoanaerobaculaceae bacterium]
MPLAITRTPSRSMSRCELTHLAREPIDVERARVQHREYERTLEALGCEVLSLPADDEFPDCVFIEDTAVVVDELAVITRPGAPSRRGETAAVAVALAGHRPVASIVEPGTLDGGDVLRVGRKVFVGLGGRTNEAGVAQLRAALAPFGYAVTPVAVGGCLHLKTAATQVAPETVLINREWVDASAFARFEKIDVDPAEPMAANTLMLEGAVVVARAYPRTAARLEKAGLALVRIDMSELAKAEGALTCCSLLLADRAVPGRAVSTT